MKRERALLIAGVLSLLQAVAGFVLVGDHTTAGIASFVNAVLTIVVGWVIRGQVTPLADPRDSRGERLVPAGRT